MWVEYGSMEGTPGYGKVLEGLGIYLAAGIFRRSGGISAVDIQALYYRIHFG